MNHFTDVVIFRERRRLQRCYLDIDSRFMLHKDDEDEEGLAEEPQPGHNRCITKEKRKRPLDFLFADDSHSCDSSTIRTRYLSSYFDTPDFVLGKKSPPKKDQI